MTLPMVLKQLRKELQLQQKELAELLGLNSTTVNRWEAGKARPSKVVCNLLLRVAKEKGASEVCLASLQDALFPKPDLEEKPNDIRYTEIESINQLLNESPNGVIVIDFETYDILYMNDKVIELTGISMEEASTMKCYQLLSQEEQPCDICHKDEMCIGETFTSVSASVRYGDCLGRHFTIRTQLITWKNQKALVKYFTDITELHELQQQVQQQQKALNYAAEFVGMQVFEYDIQKNTAMLITETSDSNGLPRIVENFDQTVLNSNIILPEYLRAYNQMLQEIKEGKKQAEAEVLTSELDGTSYWLHFQMNQTALSEDGEPLTAICSVRVINREKSLYAQLAQEQQVVQDLFAHIPGGVCLYRWHEKSLEAVSVSNHFSDLLGVDYPELKEKDKNIHYENVHPDDLPQLREFMIHSLNIPGEGYTHTFRLWNRRRECYLWVLATANVIAQAEGSLVYVNYTNIDKSKRMEAKFQQEREMLSDACDFANIWTWIYDIPRDQIYPSAQLQRDFGMPEVLENFPQSWFDMGFVMPDYIELHRQKVQAIRDGSDSEEFEIQIRHRDGTIHWTHIRFHRLEKNPELCSCTSQLIDNEKVLQARMRLENKKMLTSDKTMIGYVITNLSQNDVLEVNRSSDEYHAATIRQPMEPQVEQALQYIMEADCEKYRLLHDRNKLIEAYHQGKNELEFIGHRLDIDGGYYWMRNVLNLVQEPTTGDIYLYEYLYDIHAQKMLEEITATVSVRDYERIASVNLHTKQMTIIDTDSTDSFGRSVVCDHVAYMNQYAKDCIVEPERTMFLTKMSVEYIAEALSAQETSEFLYHTIEKDGSLRCHRAKYAYYDREQGICIITRTDVTQTMHQEELCSKELAEALNQAKDALELVKVATKAKSDFLSRMSHDMRTPLNAIIGLCALTLDDAKEPAVVRDNMSKMRSASDFLLGLVNDILDMAKIEDGSVVLNPEPHTYFEFLSNLRTMFPPQCDAKGITLTFQEQVLNPVVLVDKLRMLQVFFNILSNAVKYTPPGGRIDFTAENLSFEKGYLNVDFVIRDTGIGMSEEYQKHLFEPFQRENNGATAELQGSGLGLSITKQLVELMGGSIQITSKKNVGTTVQLSFHLECLQKDHKEEKQTRAVSEHSDAILIGKHVLLAEDYPLNAQIAKRLLEKKQMLVSHTENGKLAVEMFAASKEREFDTILMDIRMPLMDGLEATRQIRKLDRSDAKTVPILAMSANAYPEDVQKSLDAGMNGHLAKPVNPEVLYRELTRYMSESKCDNEQDEGGGDKQ